MPRPRLLTARFVDTVKPDRLRREYGDASGGRLLVHPSGTKTWVHRYRDATGKPRKDTLGPATGEGALSLAGMREAVARVRRQLDDGVPIPRRVAASSADGVATLAAQFLAKHHVANNRRSTAIAAERTFNNIVLPAWGARDVRDVRRRDVIELAEATATERGPAAAGHLVRVLSKFFGWLVTRDVIEASPLTGVAGALPRRPKPRSRVLDHLTELRPLLRAADTDRPTDRVVRVLAYTGQRRSEVGGMCWSEIDPEARVWTIPAARSKNHRAHRVPLSPQVWRIIDGQPRIANCDYVFSYGQDRPVNDWHAAKRRLIARAGIGDDWRIHDIRRTTAAGLQRLGVRSEVIERALNHRSGSFAGIVGTYQVDPLEGEVRAALQRWADYVDEFLAGSKSSRVVKLSRR